MFRPAVVLHDASRNNDLYLAFTRSLGLTYGNIPNVWAPLLRVREARTDPVGEAGARPGLRLDEGSQTSGGRGEVVSQARPSPLYVDFSLGEGHLPSVWVPRD